MTLQEPSHPPNLGGRLTCRLKLLTAGLTGRGTGLALSPKVGTSHHTELFGLPFVVGELGLDTAEIAIVAV